MARAYPEWKRLQDILEVMTAEGFARLDADEIIEFGKLYRRATAELAFHRTHEADPERIAFLNDLVGKCYPHVYVAPRRPWPSVKHFFRADFPRTFRRQGFWILLAFLICVIPGIIGFAITWHDRAIADQVLPPELLESSFAVAERHHTANDWLPAEERPENASFIMTHNIGLTIVDFAGGMTGGVVTIISLIYNGLMLGIVAAAVGLDGFDTANNFWAFVAPHGVFELTAIFIAGGAGLLIGYALINPGELPRRVALRNAGKEALKLILGVCAMLLIAGTIEAFFSPMNIPEEIKYIAASGEFVFLFSYLFLAGRHTQETEEHSPASELLAPLPPV